MWSLKQTVQRRRSYLAFAVVATIAIGLASRRYPAMFPAVLGKYPGDALWAQMVYWCVCFLFPTMSVSRVAFFALAISYLDEASQLYQADWINHFRATTVGHLLLGSRFSWLDLLSYPGGVGLCCLVEALVFRVARHPPIRRPKP